ncbi:hypothetical protein BCR33DRAFT_769840 [Rhizoclosmatium globosum]|uniref:Uncharacterized protein n=1 Tax=Rhizoclosmatium globosum TaxID=329046 RepID=A0A1Y2BR07_9FUNG|nr:hypothetical protein BCR33DRAFT_769840 [Rhizoclosmatium globosum]|eukprot:ORY37180.1 hypothetical protein BCR33DRAFT_769840 [Rhizoclosmatium globosum]
MALPPSKDHSHATFIPSMTANLEAAAAKIGRKNRKDYSKFGDLEEYSLLSILKWRSLKPDFKATDEIEIASRVLHSILARPSLHLFEPDRLKIAESSRTFTVQAKSEEVHRFFKELFSRSSSSAITSSSPSHPPLVLGGKRKEPDTTSDEVLKRCPKKCRKDSITSRAKTIDIALMKTPGKSVRTLSSSGSKYYSSSTLELATREGLRFLKKYETIVEESFMGDFVLAIRDCYVNEATKLPYEFDLECLDLIGILKMLKTGQGAFKFVGSEDHVSEVIAKVYSSRNTDAHAPSGGLSDIYLVHIMSSVAEFLSILDSSSAVWAEYNSLKENADEDIGKE